MGKGPLFSWLIRHDAKVISGEFRTAFSGWGDRALLVAVLLVAAAILRSTAKAVPAEWLTTAALIPGAAAGAALQNVARARLRFFVEESALAHEALRSGGGRAYLLSLHGAGLALLLLATVAARPLAAPILAAGYACGAAAMFVLQSLFSQDLFGSSMWVGRQFFLRVRRGFRHPAAGVAIALAAAALAWLLHERTSEPLARTLVGGILAAALLIFAQVDHAEVRFEAMSGFSTSRSLRWHSAPCLMFLGVLIPLAAMFSLSFAALSAVAGAFVVGFSAAKICLYRAHSKRTSDVLLAVLVGGLALMTMSVPILLPPVALAVALLLWRRSASASWLIQ